MSLYVRSERSMVQPRSQKGQGRNKNKLQLANHNLCHRPLSNKKKTIVRTPLATDAQKLLKEPTRQASPSSVIPPLLISLVSALVMAYAASCAHTATVANENTLPDNLTGAKIDSLDEYFDLSITWRDGNHNGFMEDGEVSPLTWQIVRGVAEFHSEQAGQLQLSGTDLALFRTNLNDAMSPQPTQQFHRLGLPNGLILLLGADHSSPLVSVGFYVGAGSRDATIGGEAHLTEHLLTTRNQGGVDFFAMMAQRGTFINAQTGSLATRFMGMTRSNNLAEPVNYFSQALLHPSLSQANLSLEKMIIAREGEEAQADPIFALQTRLFETAFSNRRRQLLGDDLQALSRVTLADVQTFLARHYSPTNTIVSITGDIEPREAHHLIEQKLASWRPTLVTTTTLPAEPAQSKLIFRVLPAQPAQASFVALGYKTPTETEPNYAAVQVALHILNTRLKTRVPQLNLFDLPRSATIPYEAFFSILSGAVASTGMSQTLTDVLTEVEVLRRYGVTPGELHQAQIDLRLSKLRDQEDIERVQEEIARAELLATPELNQRLDEQIAALTPREVQSAAAAYFAQANCTMVVQPQAEAEESAGPNISEILQNVGSNLANITPTPRTTEPPHNESLPPLPTPTKIKVSHPEELFLPNGIKLAFQRNNRLPLVTFDIMFPTGGSEFTQDEVTLALQSMLAGNNGTSINDEIAAFGGRAKVEVLEDVAHVTVEVLSDKLLPAVDLMTSALTKSTISTNNLEQLREAHLSKLMGDLEDPRANGLRILRGLLKSPNLPPDPAGLRQKEGIDQLTPEDLRGCQDKLVRSGLVFSVVGDIAGPQIEHIKRQLKTLTIRQATTTEPTSTAPINKAVLRLPAPIPVAGALIGFNTLGSADPDYPALKVLSSILARRLSVAVREEKGLAYYITFRDETAVQSGFAYAAVQTSPENLEEVLALINEEINRLHTSSEGDDIINAEEVAQLIRLLSTREAIFTQTNSARATNLAQAVLAGSVADSNLSARFSKVTVADVRRLAQRLLDPEHSASLIIEPMQP